LNYGMWKKNWMIKLPYWMELTVSLSKSQNLTNSKGSVLGSHLERRRSLPTIYAQQMWWQRKTAILQLWWKKTMTGCFVK
jgi:hypothetical protein